MKNVNSAPLLTRLLLESGVFSDAPFNLVDVGARAGYSHQWNHLGRAANVIGFEPDIEECERLNATEHEVKFHCLPIALDSHQRKRAFFINKMNTAGSGFYPGKLQMARRFHATELDIGGTAYRDSLGPAVPREVPVLLMETQGFDQVAVDRGISSVDFFKIDAEGAELDILKGAESALGDGGALGMEVEVLFMPVREENPLFGEVCVHLAERGYQLFDLDAFHYSRAVLPTRVAWDHRNHEGKRILGPTMTGQLGHGDALFFRDLIGDGFNPSSDMEISRVFKAVCLFDLYGLVDCAAELLVYYWDALRHGLDISLEKLLDKVVPHPHGGRMSHAEYMEIHARTVGRMDG